MENEYLAMDRLVHLACPLYEPSTAPSVVHVSVQVFLCTCGDASSLVTPAELHSEVGHQGVDVVVPAGSDTVGCREGQLLSCHSVQVYFLQHRKWLARY